VNAAGGQQWCETVGMQCSQVHFAQPPRCSAALERAARLPASDSGPWHRLLVQFERRIRVPAEVRGVGEQCPLAATQAVPFCRQPSGRSAAVAAAVAA